MKYLTQLAIVIASVFCGSLLQAQSIINPPASTTVALGASFTLHVLAIGNNLSYQWYSVTGSTNIDGATNNTYTVASAAYSDAGNYKVIVSGDSGSVSNATSATVTVVKKPSITTNPVGAIVATNTDVTLTVVPDGDGPTYQWYKGTNSLGGATLDHYLVSGASINNSGNYTVVVTNAVGAATSAVAVVQFIGLPVITTNPVTPAYIATGSNYTLSVAATGSYLNYQWYMNGTNFTDATNASYTIVNGWSNANNGSYSVSISNLAGGVSVASAVKVYDLPTITTSPSSIVLASGTAGSLTVVGNAGGGNLSYQWMKGSSNVTSGGQAATLNLAGALTDSGTYSVVVSNEVGKVTSASATVLVVSTPHIATQPVGKAVAVGGTYTLSVTVSNAASSALSYFWQVDTGSGPALISAADTNSNTLVLSSTDLATHLTNIYSVIVSNAATPGAAVVTSTNATVTVQIPPALVSQSSNKTVALSGPNVVLTVTNTGDALGYQWRNGSVNITNNNTTNYTVLASSITNSGTYSVLITNLVGSVTSSNMVVLIVAPPSIVTQPQTKGVKVGATATFSVVCSNASISALSYQWLSNGVAVTDATNSTFTTAPARLADDGTIITVNIKNAANTSGLLSDPATWVVESAPAISSQPASTSVGLGTNLSLSVSATGGQLAYQWRKGSTVLPNMTNSILPISTLQTTNSGSYSVTITNVVGSTSSIPAVVWIVPAPVIVTNPSTAGVIEGDDHTLVVSVVDADISQLTYKWYTFTNGASVTNVIDGETDSSLFFSSIGSESDGNYFVVVTNAAGAATSTVATLTVQVPPHISVQPTGTNAAVNANVNLAVTASGGTATFTNFYQWLKNGTNFVSGFGSNAITIAAAQISDSGSYSVIASNLVGVDTSISVPVLVVAAPSITTQPASQVLQLGSDCTFTVVVANAATSLLNYQWYFGSTPISGATSSTLLVPAVPANEGSYSVTISNQATPVTPLTSQVATLTVLTTPVITNQPASTNVPVGSNIVLTVGAAGGSLSYEWYRGATPLHANTNTLVISNAQISASGIYSARVSNSMAVTWLTSSNATVQVVAKPIIRTSPIGGAARVGNGYQFIVAAANPDTSALTYQWFLGTSPISGATNAEYDILVATLANTGDYTVLITNVAGATSNTPAAHLDVQNWPIILASPSAQTVASNTPVVLTVNASGTGLGFFWFKDGVGVNPSLVSSTANSSTLTIPNSNVGDSGSYSVVASNLVGTATTAGVPVVVLDPPVVLTSPVGGIAVIGNDVLFSTVMSNAVTATMRYQWMFANATTTNIIASAPNTNAYTLPGASFTSIGKYWVIVTNLAGRVTSAVANLDVQAPPGITVQPQGINLTNGGTLTLNVTATGGGLTYQWRTNGGAIAGQTGATLTLPGMTVANSANYSVLVTNNIGRVTSADAAVLVVAVPSITTPPASQTNSEYSDVTFTVGVANAATSLLHYQWLFKGNPIASATSSTLVVPQIQPSDAGAYRVIVTNIAGAVTSAPAVLTVETAPFIVTQPLDTNHANSGNVVLTVDALGNKLSFQWYNGTNAIVGSNDVTLTIPAIVANSGFYSVLVTNDSGALWSDVAEVLVVAAPNIHTQPASQILASGDECSFNVVVDNADTSLLSYQWYSTNVFGGTPVPIDGATTDTLLLGDVGPGDSGGYMVTVYNIAGSVDSSYGTLLVQDFPSIVTPPADSTYAVGAPISLTVVAAPVGVSYQWFQNGSALGGASATTANYTKGAAAVGDIGSYTVTVWNQVGTNTSAPAIVDVLVTPSITVDPASAYVRVGSSLTLTSAATGGGLSYIWNDSTGPVAGTTTNFVVDTSTALTNNYFMTASNSVGTADSAVAKIVVEHVPVTNSFPASTNSAKGDDFHLSVTVTTQTTNDATTTGDALVYKWFKGGVAVTAGGAVSGENTPSLTFTSAVVTNSGAYSVVISNHVGSVTSLVGNVMVVAPPVITVQPVGGVTNIGQDFTFSVQARNPDNSLLAYQWYSTNTSTTVITPLNDLSTNSSLTNYTIHGVSLADSGMYFVVVSNIAGSNLSKFVTLQVQGFPQISNGGDPVSTNVLAGSNMWFDVTATGAGIGYVWYKDSVQISNASTASISIPNPTIADAGNYFVVVTNSVGSVTSQVATATVVNPVVITAQPLSRTLKTGSASVTFKVTVTNNCDPHYAWYKNASVTPIGGATGPTLTFNSITKAMAGSYHCEISNFGTNAISDMAVLTVLDAPTIANGDQPVSVTNVAINTSFALQAVATTGDTPGYQWYKNGVALGSGTSATYTGTGALSDAGIYYVTITNAVGSVTSSNVTVNIVAVPVISSQPLSRNVAVGSNYTFTVAATNVDASLLSYYWEHRTLAGVSNVVLSADSSYRLAPVGSTDAGDYSVIVSNIAGKATSVVAQLVVMTSPTISSRPSAGSVAAGSDIVLSVGAAGGVLGYQWSVSNGVGITTFPETSSTLTVHSASTTDSGTYSVLVTNAVGSTNCSAAITVLDTPVIQTQPQSQIVAQGVTYTFSVIVSNATLVDYTWYQVTNNPPLSAHDKTTNILSTATNSLMMTHITTNMAGDYYVVVHNVKAYTTSSVATLSVQTTPVVTLQPANVTVGLYTNFTILANVDGIGVGYQWSRNGVRLSNGSKYSGVNSTNLMVTGPVAADSGAFTLTATNTMGSITTTNAIVWVVAAPGIKTQPLGRDILQGSSYVFSVGVSNADTSAISYQWKKNTVDIPGETNVNLRLSNLSIADTADYTVLVSNVAGTQLSSIATLQVMAVPVFTLQPVSTNLPVGSNLVMTANATGGYITYIWNRGATVLGVTSSNSFTLPNVTTNDSSATYFVVVTNSVGRATSTNAAVLVVAKPGFLKAPVGATLTNGSKYTLSATMSNAASSMLTYQWFYSNVTDIANTAITGATSNNLALTSVSNTTYTLLVTNIAGSVSNSAAIGILAVPSITSQPLPLTVVSNGANLQLAVTTTPVGVSYQWKKGTTVLASQTTGTLTINPARLTDAGTYTVTVTNSVGKVTSSNMVVNVVMKPVFLKQPVSITAAPGSTNTFSVTMSNAANSALTYQWQTNSPTDITALTNLIVGATSNSVTMKSITTADAQAYCVVVSNAAGSVTSTPAILTVTPAPTFAAQQPSTNHATGSLLSLTNLVNGSGLRFQWLKGSTVVKNATNYWLDFPNVKASDSGTYTMWASNAVGKITSSNVVVLVMAVPGIQTQPIGKYLVTGTNYTLTVVASNAATSALSYQWKKGASNLGSISTNNSLRLTGVTSSDNGTYSVVVSNIAGTATSTNVTITVEDAPAISVQPVGVRSATNVDVTLTVTATGTGAYYKWLRGTNVVGEGTGLNTVTVSAPVVTNSGVYNVTITNHVGKVVSSNAIVSIVAGPTITTNLATTAAAVGSNYTFKVAIASATNAFASYKWWFNGIVVEGAFTNTLPLKAITSDMQGTYQVVITNIAGAVTSTAYLTVQAKPAITVQPISSTTVSNGSPVTLSVTATGDALVYQWRKAVGTGFTNIAGATTNVFSIDAAGTNNAGSYSVVISNLVGAVTSTKSAVIVIKNLIVYKSGAATLANALDSNSNTDFSAAAGDYTGLFVAANGVPTHQSAGLLMVSVTSSGAYSGKMLLAGASIAISGQLDSNNSSVAQFTRPGKTPVTVSLTANTANQQLTGTVSSTGWTSALTADRTANPSSNAGGYGLVIPATDPADGLSASGSLSVSTSGSIIFIGTTSEGKSISQSTTVSKDGYWAFYIPYADGEIIGWLRFINGKPAGTLNWINSTDTDSTVSEVVGSVYTQ